MSEKNMSFLSGDEAVAIGVRLSRPHVISAYPITPQTIVVERLSEFVENGSLKAEFLHVESEHSAMAAAMGVSSVGARPFTATSSQGLLHMAECLHYASGSRFPIVMMNANRSLAAPWSIYGDQRDSLSLLDSGWIQVYVETVQEALDMIIQAYKIAEHNDVLTPFMVNLDGFILTHTYEPVDIPAQEKVDAFLPPYETFNKMSFEKPMSLCFSSPPDDNLEFRYIQHRAMEKSRQILQEVNDEFAAAFGRDYTGIVENYLCDDAEAVLITLGSVAGTVRTVVDELRAKGQKVGLCKIRYMRPFPTEEIIALGKKVSRLGVLEKDISFGYEGTVFTNVSSALVSVGQPLLCSNYIGGFGGRSISKENIREIFRNLLENNEPQRVNFIGMRCEQDDQL